MPASVSYATTRAASCHACAPRSGTPMRPSWACQHACLPSSGSSRGALLVIKAHGDDDAQGPASTEPPDASKHDEWAAWATPLDPQAPSTMQGINWYCYVVLGLLFITDFTPFGQLVKLSGALSSSGATASLWLAALQWGVFVVPTIAWIRDRKWDVRRTLRLNGCSPGAVLAAGVAGAGLWALISAALFAKSGVSMAEVGGALDKSVLGSLVQLPTDAGQWAVLVGAAAVSPAAAEEILFRGFLLTALQERLGRIDAALLCGALFALSHLDLAQFFALTVMGSASGLAVLAADSILPAIALHMAYNAAALSAGVLVAGV